MLQHAAAHRTLSPFFRPAAAHVWSSRAAETGVRSSGMWCLRMWCLIITCVTLLLNVIHKKYKHQSL